MEIWPQMPVGVLNRSLGRALEWHSRGQRFDPAYLHQAKSLETQRFRGFFYMMLKNWVQFTVVNKIN